jgi:aspartyl-tRNA(Asn)/glutamyl-tRNA(Gln) amidotransferase subunit B
MEYEPVIGLEVHAQLLTESKLFCPCSTKFGGEPNTQTCPRCLGMPGVLPVLNKQAVEFAIRASLAMNCSIADKSVFARKNYFYPDLPKGYQISMYERPFSVKGWLDVDVNGKKKRIGITRIHMEDDAGKLVHAGDFARAEHSYVDLNRTGVPLLEIVSEPDIRSPEEAAEYMRRLRNILVYIGVCDGNMQEGSLRCDANVSVRPKNESKFGTRAEIKNMNSFRNIQRAMAYEIERQIKLCECGEAVVQETRLWDDAAGKTMGMRGKEEAHDYRYFPDPDLIPIAVDKAWIEIVRKNLPELPLQKKERFIKDYQIPEYDAALLTQDKVLADYFETVIKEGAPAKWASNWIMTELLRELNTEEKSADQSPVKPSQLVELYRLIAKGTISTKIAKGVFESMYKTGKGPEALVKAQGLVQVSDDAEIGRMIDEVLKENPAQLEQFLSGKDKLFGFFIGQIMKKSQGKANPAMANKILAEKLNKLKGKG